MTVARPPTDSYAEGCGPTPAVVAVSSSWSVAFPKCPCSVQSEQDAMMTVWLFDENGDGFAQLKGTRDVPDSCQLNNHQKGGICFMKLLLPWYLN